MSDEEDKQWALIKKAIYAMITLSFGIFVLARILYV
jgi:hypothetical protein